MSRKRVPVDRGTIYAVVRRRHAARFETAELFFSGTLEECQSVLAEHSGERRFAISPGPCRTADEALQEYINMQDALAPFLRD